MPPLSSPFVDRIFLEMTHEYRLGFEEGYACALGKMKKSIRKVEDLGKGDLCYTTATFPKLKKVNKKK